MNDAFVGVLIAIGVFAIAFCGFMFGRESVINDCDDFGAFVVAGLKYECKKVEK